MTNVADEMGHLFRLSKRDPTKRFTKLWCNVTSERWLALAWETIRKNKGSKTPGVDGETGNDVDLVRIRKLSRNLKGGKYRPKPVRRVFIPKEKGKLRPLGIPTIEDRIVQQALRMVLEPIFEADFLTCSHGFRRKRSTHTALRDVAVGYIRTSWIIEGDIVGCFDNIPHGKLMEQISRRIADEKVCGLIWAFLKAGYLEDWVYHRTYSGTPQGGIISPLLCNIFLHQLDEFMVKDLGANALQSEQTRSARRAPAYLRLSAKLTKRRRRLKRAARSERQKLIEEIERMEQEQKRMAFYVKRHPTKLGYVRYADDFLILVNGTKIEAEQTKAEIKGKLLSMGLELSEEKTRITHWSKPVDFLGYRIRGKLKWKGFQIFARFSIPPEKRRKIEREIKRVCSWHHMPELDALTTVSALYRGWCNYYRYVARPQKHFGRLSWYAWWTFARYLAKKQKSSIATLIRQRIKAGLLKKVTRDGRTLQLFIARVGNKEIPLNIIPPNSGCIFKVGKSEAGNDLRALPFTGWALGRSMATRETAKARAGGICEDCGEKPVYQVHHPRGMKGKSHRAKVESDAAQRDSARALCKDCHEKAHGIGAAREQKSNRNAGCAERYLSGVGRAA